MSASSAFAGGSLVLLLGDLLGGACASALGCRRPSANSQLARNAFPVAASIFSVTKNRQQEEHPRCCHRHERRSRRSPRYRRSPPAAPRSPEPPSGKPADRPAQTALTGDAADKVRAAALEKVPGGTVLRVESGGPSGSKYHAHVRKSDGTEVVVLVNSQFEATKVEEFTRP